MFVISAFLRTCLKVRIFVEAACIFEVRGVHQIEVIVVKEADNVLDWAQIGRLPSLATIHPKAFPI